MDNTATYSFTGRLITERHPTISWTPYATHCLYLMLEDIGKIGWIKRVVEDAKQGTKFIYNHTRVLSLMRDHMNGKKFVLPEVTQFATHFLTLQSIVVVIPSLKQEFISTT